MHPTFLQHQTDSHASNCYAYTEHISRPRQSHSKGSARSLPLAYACLTASLRRGSRNNCIGSSLWDVRNIQVSTNHLRKPTLSDVVAVL
jgi:hypothetical protein